MDPVLNSPELSCEVLAPLANSDHKTVVLTLSSPSSHKHFPQPRKTVWIYKKADIQLAKRLLRDLPMASTSGSIDIFWKKWSKSFLAAIRKFIPSKLVPIKSSTPWINREIRKDIAKRALLYKRYKKSNSQEKIQNLEKQNCNQHP